MLLGYNTNGFAHHALEDALIILSEIGYRSVALTLDYHALNPYDPDVAEQTRRVAEILHREKLACVVETGARFLLDPRAKHSPTLLDDSSAAQRRLDFLLRAVDLAATLHADAVSFWSGARPAELSERQALDRLVDGCRRLLDRAERHEVRMAFEPEPGMFVDRMDRFAELHGRLNHPLFGLTLDVGHVHCLDDGSVTGHISNWKDCLFNIHIEDMRRGIHDHLEFGRGDINFPPIFAALRETGYSFGLHVELSRHSYDAVATARRAYAFLRHLQ